MIRRGNMVKKKTLATKKLRCPNCFKYIFHQLHRGTVYIFPHEPCFGQLQELGSMEEFGWKNKEG